MDSSLFQGIVLGILVWICSVIPFRTPFRWLFKAVRAGR